MLVFKRLEERRNLKSKILNIEELHETEFKTTMKRKRLKSDNKIKIFEGLLHIFIILYKFESVFITKDQCA